MDVFFCVTAVLLSFPFSALTLLVGWQEGHPACKNWMFVCWWWWFDWSSARLQVRCGCIADGPQDSPSPLAHGMQPHQQQVHYCSPMPVHEHHHHHHQCDEQHLQYIHQQQQQYLQQQQQQYHHATYHPYGPSSQTSSSSSSSSSSYATQPRHYQQQQQCLQNGIVTGMSPSPSAAPPDVMMQGYDMIHHRVVMNSRLTLSPVIGDQL